MTLLEECITALGENAIILSEEETKATFESMLKNFTITTWGRIDWDNVKHAIQLSSITDIAKHLNIEDKIYILWDEASLPSIQAKLGNALNVIDDVTAVSFDTWLYNPTGGYVIEFYHEGDIRVGLPLERYKK